MPIQKALVVELKEQRMYGTIDGKNIFIAESCLTCSFGCGLARIDDKGDKG